MNERAAFEKNIDANPLDSSNHLVYADWLDENGEPDEAAFRRAMGEWIGQGEEGASDMKTASSRYGVAAFRHYKGPDHSKYRQPEGSTSIHASNAPPWLYEGDIHAGGTGARRYWPSYRDMETYLRERFIDNRLTKMARFKARRYMRNSRG